MCQCITQREGLPGGGDLAGQGGRADREVEKVVLFAWEERRQMPKGWSRVVWTTPGTAPRKAEEGEAGTDTTEETGRFLGPESWTLREAELGLKPGGAGATVLPTCFLGADTLHSPLGM